MSFQLPTDYAYVVAVACATGFVNLYQVINVSRARKAAGIKYPALYATDEQCAKDPKAQLFNCCQRAHANTLEGIPFILFQLLFTGLDHPKLAAALGAMYVVGRVRYTIGYSTGIPSKRNGAINNIGTLGLLLASSYSAVNMVAKAVLKAN